MQVFFVVWAGLFAVAAGARGQRQIPAATATGLISLAGRASVIFSGRVVEVNRNDEDGYVDIAFHVDHAVRGCSDGSTYVLREWAGLWIGNPVRYEAGQRLLILLPARGSSGMSAPIAGLAGVIPVIAGRLPPLIHGKIPAPGTIASESDAVDLRWVEALAVPRPVRMNGAAARDMELMPGRWPGPVTPLPVTLKDSATGPSLTAVLALLEQANAR